jgi:hypothetical protein
LQCVTIVFIDFVPVFSEYPMYNVKTYVNLFLMFKKDCNIVPIPGIYWCRDVGDLRKPHNSDTCEWPYE